MTKHYLFTNGDFASPKHAQETFQWVEQFRAQFTAAGLKMEFFSPWQSRVEIGDTVHIFGLSQMENWIRLKQVPSLVYVYSLPIEGQASFFAPSLWKLGYEFLRKKLKKETESLSEIFSAVDGYFLNSADFQQMKRVIKKHNIYALSESPEVTAQTFLKVAQKSNI